MKPGPLTRIRLGEPSPTTPKNTKKPLKPVFSKTETSTQGLPSKTERNKAKRKRKAENRRAKNMSGKPSVPAMETTRPKDRKQALSWIGTRMARLVFRSPFGPYVEPEPIPGAKPRSPHDKNDLEVAEKWAKDFSIPREPVTSWSNKILWKCYEEYQWVRANYQWLDEKLVAMQEITEAFEFEFERLKSSH